MVEQSQLFHLVAFADILAQPLVATTPFPVPPVSAAVLALAHEIRMGISVISAPSDVDPRAVHESVVNRRSPWRRHFHTVEIVGFPFERGRRRGARWLEACSPTNSNSSFMLRAVSSCAGLRA